MTHQKKKINLLPFFKNRRPAQMAFIISFLLPVLLVTVPVVFLPVYVQLKTQKQESRTDKHLLAAPSAQWASRMADMQVEEAYLKSLWQLSKKDSIMLSIDLQDSLISILIKGIPARQCTLREFSMSHAIRHFARRDTMHAWLYPPFKLQREWATIPKSPIRIMDAPKDTIEASAMAGEEIPIEKNDVHFTLEFDRGLTVIVKQIQTPSWEGRKRKLRYDWQRLTTHARETIADLKNRRLPRQPLRIELYITREDAKAIYRAVPTNLEMALRL